MSQKIDNDRLRELARQLSCPEGEYGIKTGEQMNISNGGMTELTIDSLGLRVQETVLEIGPGNASHAGYLLRKADDIRYTGIDISATMVDEARKINQAFVETGHFTIEQTDGLTIPFPDNSFDRVFTVNTVYFWEQPLAYASEIYRVLRPGGTFHLAFTLKEFMLRLPFTQYGFQLYDVAEAVQLLKEAGFTIKEEQQHMEEITSNAGHAVTRTFAIVIVSK